jgi:hypothetical protein
MTESASAVAALLKPILEAWVHRDEMKAAKVAGGLTFWRSGMLKQLEAIADGTATAKTRAELRKNFKRNTKQCERDNDPAEQVARQARWIEGRSPNRPDP